MTDTGTSHTSTLFQQPKAVYAVAFACVISFMGIGLVDPILKSIAAQLQATPSQVSLMFTSYMAIMGIAMLVTGVVSSRIGPKRTLLSGLVLIIVFGINLGWLPVLGKGPSTFVWSMPSTWMPFWFRDWAYLAMPAFALGWYFSGAMLRITRSGMLDVLGSDYIKLVRLKGVPERMVVAKHALKNSMIPVLTFAGLNLLIMVNVAVVIEVIFNWPGVGQLLYDALSNRDFPMVQGVVLMSGLMIVLLNFTIDVLYGYVDPRIRLSR